MALINSSPKKVYFPASYRTQKVLRESNLQIPKNLIIVDPVGYNEFLALITNSRGVITDSGTVVEETAVLGIPSIQMRKSTERPQTYDSKSSIKFDPSNASKYNFDLIFKKLEFLNNTKWEHGLGDGKASFRIYEDLTQKLLNDKVYNHLRSDYHLNTDRSYREDDITL